jgi:PA14 domain
MTSLFLAVILAWDPSPTPGVKYRLYYGPNSGQQTIFVDAGNSTVAEVKDEDLPPGVPIYFVARAYIGVYESGPSNEVVYTQPVPTPTPTPTPSPTESAGFVTREVWRDVYGWWVGAIPVEKTPTSLSQIGALEAPPNDGDEYGQRIRGYITAPTTGNYTFWIASDDHSELWLSIDDQPANKRRIASLNDWVPFREFHWHPGQKSLGIISLTKGVRYYVEVLHKEASGGDHVSVAWAKPGDQTNAPSEIVPGSVLSPFISDRGP